ncbi:MAG TPA: extracellular solute-binding protein [Deinococcales bacterium]|nr:extracellular solute-binding protein [Deinococcales bacterium]
MNTIALPPDWANYGEIMDTFSKNYGIKITNASPNASSAEELQAIRSLKGQNRAPDVVDVGVSFALSGATEGLYAPYKVSTWNSIPAELKDPKGLWTGDYYGVISFGVNRTVVKNPPKTWADLKKPEYKGQVALNGSPTTAAAAFAGVWAAALANGGSLDNIEPGIQFFADLKKMGNFIPVDSTPATVETGQTPISIDWDYLNLGYSKEFSGKIDWTTVVPTDGVYGGFYAQAVSATAPNPNAAKLWMEFLYSDAGQLLFLKGYTHPVRFNDMVKRKVVPADLLAKLPDASLYAKVKFATQAQIAKAQAVVKAEWASKVGGQ